MLEESQKLVAAAGDDWGVQRVAASLGEIAWRRGDVAAAADHWEKALEFYRRQNDNQRILMMTRSLGEAQIRAGRYQQAEKLVLDLRELAARLGDRTSEGEACVSQAWLQLRLGFPFQAREPLDCALARDTNLGDRKRLRQVIAWLAYEQGDYDLALRGWSEIKSRRRRRLEPRGGSLPQGLRQRQRTGPAPRPAGRARVPPAGIKAGTLTPLPPLPADGRGGVGDRFPPGVSPRAKFLMAFRPRPFGPKSGAGGAAPQLTPFPFGAGSPSSAGRSGHGRRRGS